MSRLFTITVLWIAMMGPHRLIGQDRRDGNRGERKRRPMVAVRTMGPGLAVRQSGPIVYSWQINVIDRAHFNAADLLVQKGEPAEAIEELKQIVENSPDEDAIPAAHLSIGNILQESMNDPDGAVTEYKNVTGPLTCYAAKHLAEIFRGKNQPAQGASVVEEILPKAQRAQPIALILVILSKLYDEAGDRAKAIQTLRRGSRLIPDNNDALFRIVNSDQIRKTLEEMARQKEAGNDAEADELINDIKNPWRRRVRELRERRKMRRQ